MFVFLKFDYDALSLDYFYSAYLGFPELIGSVS